MAFILPVTAYLIFNGFRKVFGDSKKDVVVGSFIAGYIGITVAAFLCGLEIGIQPFIEPGYSPYPYWLSIPAMLFAHLTVAGVIEGVVTAGVVEYLYSTYPYLLNIHTV